MSIAEKLTQIAENEQKVYEAGKKPSVRAFGIDSCFSNKLHDGRHLWECSTVYFGDLIISIQPKI
jgi:hypothetical protein